MLEFEVKNQKLTRLDVVEPATDSEQYLKAKFTVKDADWNGKAKTALFRLGEVVYKALLDSNNMCIVPSEVLIRSESKYARTQGSKIHVSLIGELNTTRITTNEVCVVLNTSGYTEALTPENPTESEYQQIITQYAKNEAAIKEAKAECETARADLVGVKNIFANAIKGNLSGAVVSADDVSPIEHEMTVGVHGKNFFDVSKITNKETATNNGNGSITIAANIYYCRLAQTLREVCPQLKAGDVVVLSFKTGSSAIQYMYFHGLQSTWHVGHYITMTDAILDSYITVYGYPENDEKYGQENVISNIQIEKGTIATEYEPFIDPTTMTVSRCGKNLVDLSGFEFNDSNYTHIRYVGDASSDALYEFLKANTGKSIVISMKRTGEQTGIDIGSIRYYTDENKLLCYIVPNVAHTIIELPDTYVCSYIYGATNGASVKDLQIEFGIVPTDFEAYKGADFTPSADGTVEGITSLSPNMTILTDTEGAIVECEYIKDTNKVLQKIADALNITI